MFHYSSQHTAPANGHVRPYGHELKFCTENHLNYCFVRGKCYQNISKRIFRCNWLREKEKRRDYLQKPAKYMGEKSQSKPFPPCNPSPVPYYLIPNCMLCPHSKVMRPEGNRQYWFTASPSLKSSAGITRALKGVISSEEQVHAPSWF